MGIED
ncbi:hypothetical protein V3C99_016523 [Haemonchus contortus]